MIVYIDIKLHVYMSMIVYVRIMIAYVAYRIMIAYLRDHDCVHTGYSHDFSMSPMRNELKCAHTG